MFPPNKSHLSILRPSPTTISFTVSTRSPHQCLAFQTLDYLLLLLRLILFVSTITVLAAKYADSAPSYIEALSVRVAPISWSYIVPAAIAILFLTFHRFHTGISLSFLIPSPSPQAPTNNYHHPGLTPPSVLPTEESLLTLSTLGIQTCTLSPSYLLPATVRFIPTSSIRDIFIHEAFRGFEVRYYLAVVVEGDGRVVVVFPVCGFFAIKELDVGVWELGRVGDNEVRGVWK